MESSDKPSLLREHGANVTAKDVLDAAKAGDELAETFTCTDDYGLTYTFVLARYRIAEDGTLGEDYQDGDQYPTLTWE